MQPRKIKTVPDKYKNHKFLVNLILGGWYQGKKSYLFFGLKTKDGEEFCIGTLSGLKLYRLAKAIVRQFENN